MALTDAEKVDVRRFCGYPVAGQGAPNTFTGYRYFQNYGLMEYRLNNLTASEETVLRTTYLTQLSLLETDIPATRSNLDTDKAAVWEHNKNEQRDRDRLFDSWRRRLCGYLGVPEGPQLCCASGVQVVV